MTSKSEIIILIANFTSLPCTRKSIEMELRRMRGNCGEMRRIMLRNTTFEKKEDKMRKAD